MGTPWTDESAILRDLSFAQGRWVPGIIDKAVADGKPPAHNITEETEEEYFQHWTSDGDFSSGPDLIRIKRMLELMQDQETPEEEVHTGPIEISKLNPASMFVSKRKKEMKENKTPKTKPRQARNVAIASILAFANQLATVPNEPIKLAKPEDFIKTHQDEKPADEEYKRKHSVKKVTNWLQSQDISSMSMFKKKSSVNSLKENEQTNVTVNSSNNMQNVGNNGSVAKFKQSPEKSEGVKSPSGQYTPSSFAKEYYKKAVDRSHMRSLVQEDVWSRAEKIMKQIDAEKAEALRKQQEEDSALAAAMAAAEAGPDAADVPDGRAADDAATNTSGATAEKNPEASEGSGIAYVLLPKSRHDLNNCDHEKCVVCRALTIPPKTEPKQKSIYSMQSKVQEINEPEKSVYPIKNMVKEITGPMEGSVYTLQNMAKAITGLKEEIVYTVQNVVNEITEPKEDIVYAVQNMVTEITKPMEESVYTIQNKIEQLISDSDEGSCDSQLDSTEKESKDSSDTSKADRYFELVRTTFVDNLHEELCEYLSEGSVEGTD